MFRRICRRIGKEISGIKQDWDFAWYMKELDYRDTLLVRAEVLVYLKQRKEMP